MPLVLLIDDEMFVARAMIRTLEAAGARSVAWAPGSTLACDLARETSPDIVVADFDLGPGEPTGVELIDELRAVCPDASFAVVSGLPRQVPEDVTFVDKMDPPSLRAIVSEWVPPLS